MEVVGGCGTEELARYRVAVAVFAKAGIGTRRVPFRRMEMRSQKYPSSNLLLLKKKG